MYTVFIHNVEQLKLLVMQCICCYCSRASTNRETSVADAWRMEILSQATVLALISALRIFTVANNISPLLCYISPSQAVFQDYHIHVIVC